MTNAQIETAILNSLNTNFRKFVPWDTFDCTHGQYDMVLDSMIDRGIVAWVKAPSKSGKTMQRMLEVI